MVFRKNFKKGLKKSYKKSYKKKTTTIKTTWAKPLKSMVKKLIERRLEDKIASSNIVNNEPICFIDGGITPPYTIGNNVNSPMSMFLAITQGVGQEQRIGNEITIKKWSLNGALQIGEYATPLIPQPYYVTMYILRRKDYGQITGNPSDLFQAGNNSTGAEGTIIDNTLYLNKDVYVQLFKRRFKVGNSVSLDSSGNVVQANNDFKTLHTFRVPLTKYFKNCVVKYNDAAPSPTTGKINIYILWLIAGANNMQLLSATGQPVSNVTYTMTSNMIYTDA